MPRGERIGDAYIKIHADGSGFDQDVRRQYDDLGKSLEKFGKDNADVYNKAFRKEMKRQRKFTNAQIIDGFDEAMGTLGARVERLTQPLQNSIRKRFREIFDDPALADIAANNLFKDITKGVKDIGSGDLFSDITAQMERAKRDFDKIWKEAHLENDERNKEALARLSKDFDVAIKMNEEYNREVALGRDRAFEANARRLHEQAEAQAAALKAQLQAWLDMLDEADKANKEFDQKLREDRDRNLDHYFQILADQAAADEKAERERRASAQRTLDFTIKMQRQRVQEDQKVLKQVRELEDAVERLAKGNQSLSESYSSIVKRSKELNTQLQHVEADTTDADHAITKLRLRLITLTPRISAANREFGRMADIVGRLTGRGSRNNFLNFVGSVNRNVLRLTSTIITGFFRATQVTTNFFRSLATGGLTMKDFKTLAVSAFQAVAGGLTTLITFGVVIAAVGASIGIMSSALTGLAAAITALAGSITFGLAGGVAALAGALVPLAAGIGVITAAFIGLSDAQKEALGQDLDPLQDAFSRLADLAGDFLFRDVGKWAQQLAPVIELLEPAVVRVANSIHNVIDDLVNDLANSGKFEHFIDRMTNKTETHMSFLGTATKKIGDIFTNIIEGAGGVFLAMLPLVNRFLGWLRDITGQFADWANSKGGRAELREFFEKAGDSASALGDFLGDATRALGKLLDLGKGTGDQLFRDMAAAMGRFVDYLSSPEGQKAAEDWFEWGKDLAGTLGDLVIAAGKFIGAMDTPGTREALTFILDTVTAILGFFTENPKAFYLMFGAIGPIVVGLLEVKGVIEDIWNFLTQPLGDSWLGSIAKFIIPGALGLTALDTALGAIKDTLFGGEGETGKVFGGQLSAEEWNRLAGNVAIGDEALQTLLDTLDQVTGAATQATREMALLALQEGGLDDVGRSLGISMRTLVDAALGQKDALSEVSQAIAKAQRGSVALTDEQMSLLESLGLTAESLRKERNQILNNSQAVTDFTGKLRGLPKKVKVEIRDTGIRPTINGIAQVIRKAKELAPDLNRRQIKTIIEASGVNPTIANIRKILKRINELDEAEANPEIKPELGEFARNVNKANNEIINLDRKKALPKGDLDTREFFNNEKAMSHAITTLSGMKASPKAELVLDQFYQDRATLIASLASIPDEHVNIITHRVDGGGTGSTGSTGDTGDEEGKQISTGPVVTPGPVINVYPQATDARAVAQETLNRIVAMSY